VIYTSGSTGRPKGVLVEHRNVARLFTATDQWYGFGSADVWTLLHSYAFDFSVWEIWGALAHGGRLVISPLSTTRSPPALAALVAGEGVTVLNATPSLFVTVQDELLKLADDLALRFVVFGGEALAPPTLRPWYRRFGGDGPTLVNMYGITETTVHVTYRPVSAADCDREGSPIGVPIPDLSLHLLDPHGSPVPVGVAGELFVGGAGVARGYLHRAELTAQRFIENPFGPGRLYRTGDVARRLPGGELDFRGRIDDQVKIRGFRIELGEIETVLADHPAVRTAVATVREDVPGDQRLVAYVTLLDGADLDPSALRQFVKSKLPAYMVPATVIALESLPLTANGKADRKRLPAPDRAESELAGSYAAPETPLEAELVAIWSRVLHVERIGIDDDFFELGGHSLLAIQLVQAIERELDRICGLPILFRTGTIRSLAAELIAGGADCTTPTVLKLRSDGTGLPIFCISGVHVYQELADSLRIDSPVYGIFLPHEQQMFEARRRGPSMVVEEMARGYVEAVRQEQPHGPYVFIGLSFGGFMIYEMARQLECVGEEVSLLVILDTIVPGTLKMGVRDRFIRRRGRVARQLREAAMTVGLRSAPSPGERELMRLGRIRSRIYHNARSRYQMDSWPGRAVLVRSETTVALVGDNLLDPTFGWGRHIGDIEIYDAPGDHISHLRRPHVLALGSKLSPQIKRARTESQVDR
jgi:nonribosomal peptide synthetase DhbF